MTGVLRSDVLLAGLVGDRLSAGQYMYGIPMRRRSGEGEQITWCAPRADKDNPNRFSTVCFPAVGSGFAWIKSFQPLLTTELVWPGAIQPDVIGLDVQRGPATLGAPMRLTYVFDRWRVLPLHRPAVVVASLGVEMRVNGVMSPVGHIYVVPDSAGVVRFPVQNGLMTLGAMDRAGAPLSAPPVRAEQGVKDQFLQSVDPDRVRLGVVAPTRVLGVLPIGGIVSMEVRTPAGRVARADAPPTGY